VQHETVCKLPELYHIIRVEVKIALKQIPVFCDGGEKSILETIETAITM
jgi:hypothetical protein